MKDSLKTGMTHRVTLKVDEPRTISFMGEGVRVYATPSIVSDLEYACLDLLDRHCDDGESSVGARVEISHERPTPLDGSIAIDVTVAEIKSPLVTFDVVVADAVEQVASARHIRAVVDKARLEKAVATKVEKIREAS